jgi:hypothetical protein
LTLVGHIGKTEKKADGQWVFEVNGLQRRFPTPHGVHVQPDDVAKLRAFLSAAGFVTDSRGEPYLGGHDTAPVKMVLVDPHAATVYDLRDGACIHVATVQPHDPHHFLHHLTHRDQPHSPGQRGPEDPAFYDSLISALQGAETAVIIGTATGTSAAIGALANWLRGEHGRAPARILEITDTNTSDYTVAKLAQLAHQALRERIRPEF